MVGTISFGATYAVYRNSILDTNNMLSELVRTLSNSIALLMNTDYFIDFSSIFVKLLLALSLIMPISCAKETTNDEGIELACSQVSDYVFNEKDGLLNVEFENTDFSGDWKLKNDGSGFSGEGYMVWEGEQHLGNPGAGTAIFKIRIENAGTYQFLWKSAVKIGDNGTDHNDTWLRFNDADDFYGEKGTSKVYPKDTGKTPNPEGASKDGWFKIYRSGSDLDFKWQASTFDNNGHDIYVDFENPGTYTMEVSARSSGHGIDKFVLFNDSFSKTEAIDDMTEASEITCN